MTPATLLSIADALEGVAALARKAAEHDPNQLLTFEEAGALLKVHRSTVGKLVLDGALACVRIGQGKHAVRVRQSDLEAYIDRQRTLPRRIRRAAKVWA